MVTLAIDFGLKHIGLALSDAEERIASPFKTISHRNLAQTEKDLLALCKQHSVEQIVIGDPHNDSVVRQRILGLAKRLQKHFPVHLVDESATTYETAGMVQLQPTHAQAAALILERYIHGKK